MIRSSRLYKLKRKPSDMSKNNIAQSFVPPFGSAKYSVYFAHSAEFIPIPGISVRYFITLYCSYWKIFRYLRTYWFHLPRYFTLLYFFFLPSFSQFRHLLLCPSDFLAATFLHNVMQPNEHIFDWVEIFFKILSRDIPWKKKTLGRNDFDALENVEV